jgi:hypothetical protein
MIKTFYLTLGIYVLTCCAIHGQNFSREFGKISKDEIELKKYAQDKDAEALVLFDMAQSIFVTNDGSFEVVFERTTRIKILSEAGIKWAEVGIPFYQEGGIYEKVYGIKAFAYNLENGVLKKTEFDLANLYDEKVNSHWNMKKMAIPNVKEGTIIEYKYTIHSQYLFNLRDWEFQWRIPVLYSAYEVKMIPFYEYTFLLQGANKFDSQSSYVESGLSRQYGSITFQNMVYKYAMKDLPAFNSEEFITSINDYIIKLDFQLAKIHYPNGATVEVITTWEEMNKELLKHVDFGKYIQKTEKLAAELLNHDEHEFKDESEKFNFVIDYVKGNYSWDKHYDKFASKSPKKLVDEKFGNSADLNLFTVGLLNAMGIEAKPVLLSTRDNGKVKIDYPFAHFFNYVVILANVDGVEVLTDATEISGLNNRIPSRCINDRGLIVQKEKIEWVKLESLFPSEIKTDLQIDLSNDVLVNSRISISATEYDAFYFRNQYSDNIETIKESIETIDVDIIDSTVTVYNPFDKERPYILTYQQTSKQEIVNDKIYLAPFLNEPITDNPLKQNERTYPIDMTYPKKRIFNSTIEVPEGYQIEYLPTNHQINNELFELAYSTSVVDNQIIISYGYYFKNSVYASKDFSKVKFYFNEIVKKGNERIVLAKKTESSN